MPPRPRLRRIRHPELGPRSEALRREAAERSRATLKARRERILLAARPIVHSALAASLAWIAAIEILGHERPFFAPIAAVLTLGIAGGQRRRRAVEMAFGVALGIGIADLIVIAIGTGPLQIAAVVAIAMTVALVVGGGPLLTSQAATSAVLVATLQPPSGGVAFDRFYDACVGATVALLVASLILTVNPVAIVRRRAAPVLATLRGVLEDVARALTDRDVEEAEAALLRARAVDPLLADLEEAVDAADESARIAPSRRRGRRELSRHVHAARQVDYAVGNAKVLARGAIRAIALGDATPPRATAAIRDLAEVVSALEPDLDLDSHSEAAREAALRAAGRANGVLQETGNMSASHVVGQIRSLATDLLRALGEERDSAQDAVRSAVVPESAGEAIHDPQDDAQREQSERAQVDGGVVGEGVDHEPK